MEALKKYPCPAACASLWRQPSLFGDDTHAVGHTAKVGTRARTAHLVWFLMSVGCEPGPSTGARNEDVGRSERKTPNPRATYRQRKSMFLVGKNPDDPGDDTDMEEVGVELLRRQRARLF